MKISFEARDKGTHVTLVYADGGYDSDNFKNIPKAVDGVLGEQMTRYAKFDSTGKP